MMSYKNINLLKDCYREMLAFLNKAKGTKNYGDLKEALKEFETSIKSKSAKGAQADMLAFLAIASTFNLDSSKLEDQLEEAIKDIEGYLIK